jgi:hypothetical protein
MMWRSVVREGGYEMLRQELFTKPRPYDTKFRGTKFRRPPGPAIYIKICQNRLYIESSPLWKIVALKRAILKF